MHAGFPVHDHGPGTSNIFLLKLIFVYTISIYYGVTFSTSIFASDPESDISRRERTAGPSDLLWAHDRHITPCVVLRRVLALLGNQWYANHGPLGAGSIGHRT